MEVDPGGSRGPWLLVCVCCEREQSALIPGSNGCRSHGCFLAAAPIGRDAQKRFQFPGATLYYESAAHEHWNHTEASAQTGASIAETLLFYTVYRRHLTGTHEEAPPLTATPACRYNTLPWAQKLTQSCYLGTNVM